MGRELNVEVVGSRVAHNYQPGAPRKFSLCFERRLSTYIARYARYRANRFPHPRAFESFEIERGNGRNGKNRRRVFLEGALRRSARHLEQTQGGRGKRLFRESRANTVLATKRHRENGERP